MRTSPPRSSTRRCGPGFVERFASRVPAGALAVAEAYQPRIGAMLDWIVENRPNTIAHTDFRLDNFFFDHPDGSPVDGHRLAAVGAGGWARST